MDSGRVGEPLRPWERWAGAAFLFAFLVFGVEVERRSAFLSRRMGDLGCYLRAGWAVRTGHNPYDFPDDNAWHYNYPPLFAVLMAPLGDPPAEYDHAGMVPYAVSVAVFYALSVLCLAAAVHWLASALERSSPDPAVRATPTGCRRWWLLRTLPVLACLPCVGHTLMRGQANMVLLLCVCGLMAGLVSGRRLTAGLCLAGAACLKIYPAYLLVVPLWRRDGRCLAGAALGLLLGLFVIPAAFLGPVRTVGLYRDLGNVLVLPALGLGGDTSRADELTQVVSTDSQSFQAAIHNTLHLDRDRRRAEAPDASRPVRLAHWIIGGTLTLLTLAAARRPGALSGDAVPLWVGALVLLMILLSPVCHTHYFVLEVPLLTAFLWRSWWQRGGVSGPFVGRPDSPLDGRTLALFAVVLVGNTVPQVPALWVLRDCGAGMWTGLVVWSAACVAVRQSQGATAPARDRARAAA
jgi:hypothetical protein